MADDPTATATTPAVVMITGASAGVGRATALALARQGARVGLLARGVALVGAGSIGVARVLYILGSQFSCIAVSDVR
jgi:NAD(P)-dependent dehydrogenase (short-subunit alcohol dehydrogenase family)